VEVLDLSKPVVVRIESTPADALVYTTGFDGKPSERLGRTPLDYDALEVGKQAWKFNPDSNFAEEHETLEKGALEQYVVVREGEKSRSLAQGEEVCIDLIVTMEGYRPARIIRCIKARELPQIFRESALRLHVRLVPLGEPAPKEDTR
jgi:hypothetical protein